MAYHQGPGPQNPHQNPQQWQMWQGGQPPQYPQQPYPYGQPYGYGYPPPPPPKKPGAGMVIGVIAAVVVVLVGIGVVVALLSGDESTSVAGRPTPDVTQDRDGLGQDPGENRDGQGQEPGDRSGDDGYQQAELGGTLLLRGTEGEQVAVTVTKVFDRATPKSEIFTPKAGNRWVAVELRIENKGNRVYNDSPWMGATLVDNEGQEHRPSLISNIQEGVSLTSVTISAGDSRKGVLVFELPNDLKAAKFLYAVKSGLFGNQRGEWRLS